MYTNKHIVKVSYPILLSLLAQNIIQVIDTAFLGRVGEVELGASALAGICYIAVYTLGFGFSMGSQILIGRRNGEKNFNQIGDIVVQGILFVAVAAVFLIPAMRFASDTWLPSVFHSAGVSNAVSEYLDWRFFGLFFAFINTMFRAFYIGIARTSVLTWNAVVMALVNLMFDYALIFGHLGFPEMGIGGAALASVISEIISTLFFVLFSLKTVDLEKYGFRRIHFRWSVIQRILNISVFMMVQYMFSLGTWMLFFVFIENYLGERPLAVSNIIRSFYMILTIPSNSLASATNTLVSNTIGAGRMEEVLRLVRRLALISISVIAVIIIIGASLSDWLIRIYTTDVGLIHDTRIPFYVLLCVLPVYSVSVVVFNAVSGTGNTRTALLFEIITLMAYVGYIWYIVVVHHYSVAVAWTSEIVYWSFLLGFSYFYLKRGRWKNKRL